MGEGNGIETRIKFSDNRAKRCLVGIIGASGYVLDYLGF